MARTVKKGVNDLKTWCLQNGERGQQLISEWVGLDENGNAIEMDSVARASHKKVKWRCKDCNHEWSAIINSRIQGCNCPACDIISRAEKKKCTNFRKK